MATYKPIILKNGEFQQLQSGDDLLVNGLKAFTSGGVNIGGTADPSTNNLAIGPVPTTGVAPLTRFLLLTDAGTATQRLQSLRNGANQSSGFDWMLDDFATGDLTLERVIAGTSTLVLTVIRATGAIKLAGIISGPISTPTYSASITIDAKLANLFVITVTNGTAFTMNAPSNPTTGQHIIITFRNTSGGVAGAITWNTVFKIIAPFPDLTNGNSNSLFFYYNGTNWIMSNYMIGVPN